MKMDIKKYLLDLQATLQHEFNLERSRAKPAREEEEEEEEEGAN